MTLEEARAEYERETIGPLIHGELVTLVRRTVRRYDPRVYAGVADWSDGIDDLVQEVVVERLLREGQLAYAMTVAVDDAHWRRLMVRQIRRSLARRRERTVVDNLLDRADVILAQPPFISWAVGAVTAYGIGDRPREGRRPTDGELRRAIAAAAGTPITIAHGTERAPVVYSTAALEALLAKVAGALPCRFTKNDLDRIFRALLTQWLASDLVDIEGVLQLPSESLTPEESAEVNDIVTRILRATSHEGRTILRGKLEGLSDHDLADRLGLSRPTVALRKRGLLATIAVELEDAQPRVREGVIAGLELALSSPRWGES